MTIDDVLEEQRRYYAARAPEYDDWWFRRGRCALDEAEDGRWRADVEEVEAALAAFAPIGAVVELAAGTGLWTRHLVAPLGFALDLRVSANGQFLYGSGR